MPVTRYQEGCIERVGRAKGTDVWVYRWREAVGGKRKHRARTIGTVDQYPTLDDAKRANDNFRIQVNAQQEHAGKLSVRDAWGHFQEHELRDPEVGRSQSTINGYLDYFKNQIIPHWGHVYLDDVKAVAVEKWLRSLMSVADPTKPLAPGTKAKIRNHMSALFSHCIRHELYEKPNPITSVRQSAKRRRAPDILDVAELRAIIERIEPQAIRVMTMVAAASALRRSEFRGLKWGDLDLENHWFHLQRGLVRTFTTDMKTEISRKSLEMLPEVADILKAWRCDTPYPKDDQWVFASPYTDGERPYWAESAMDDHVRPAALAAGITKHITWHVFRHSLGNILKNNREDLKTIQELLRHASPRITAEVYLQGDTETKRSALSKVSGVLVVPKTA